MKVGCKGLRHLNPVRVLEVDRLGPIVINDVADLHALRDKLLALLRKTYLGARFEGEVIEGTSACPVHD